MVDRQRRIPSASDAPGRRAAGRGITFVTCVAFVVAWTIAGPVDAAPEVGAPARCRVPDAVALADGPLPRLARRLAAGDPATVVILGSGSAAGNGTSSKDAAFPERIAARLRTAYPAARFNVVVLAAVGQTAPSMYARLRREVFPLRPALVIWQTGSADVAAGVPVTEFETTLERGIGELRDHGSDVLLVDAQFGPHASLLINTDAYREAVHWNARRYDLPLFRRYDTMQFWWNEGLFDLDASAKSVQLANADSIHDCVAAMIVRVIVHGVGEARS